MPNTNPSSILGDAIYAGRKKSRAYQRVKVCNCRGCGIELTRNAYAAGYYGIERLFGRIDGVPYCQKCYLEGVWECDP